MRMHRRHAVLSVAVLALILAGTPASAATIGSIFLTGHDPDFHATSGNTVGAQHINQSAINFIMDPGFNPFAAGGNHKFLFVESNEAPPGGHLDGSDGLTASGYTAGVDFDEVDASGLNAALNGLGTTYSAIVIGSDFGGLLTQAELSILNARSADIIKFLNSGGGLYAMAETNPPEGLATGPFFGFLPFIVTSDAKNQFENANVLTAFGASLGLTTSDINGNFSHSIFTSTGGLKVVDTDSAGDILSLAGRGTVSGGGLAPEPSSFLMMGTAMIAAAFLLRRRRSN